MKGTNAEQKLTPLGTYLLHEYYTNSVAADLFDAESSDTISLSSISDVASEGSSTPSSVSISSIDDASSVLSEMESPRVSGEDAARLASPKIANKLFIVTDPKEIPVIMKIMEGNDEIYGIITITSGRHHTPMIIKGDEVVVLESLGITKSKVGVMCAAQIAMSINRDLEKPYKVYTPANNRQLDEFSCGTDSFLAIKEGFKLGDSLFDDIRSQTTTTVTASKENILNMEDKDDPYYDRPTEVIQFPTLPPEISKYSQSMSASRAIGDKVIPSGDIGTTTVGTYAREHTWKTTVPSRSAAKKAIDVPAFRDLPAETVYLRPTTTIEMNGAIEMRRRKHTNILDNMIKFLPETKINSIIRKASGIDLIVANKKLFAAEAHKYPKPTLSSAVLIEKFIEEEKTRIRDNRAAIITKGTVALRDIMAAVAHEELERVRTKDVIKSTGSTSVAPSIPIPKSRGRATSI